MIDEKPCGCHPHMPNRRTLDGLECMGCGWGGRVDVHMAATDVRAPRRREVEPEYEAATEIPVAA